MTRTQPLQDLESFLSEPSNGSLEQTRTTPSKQNSTHFSLMHRLMDFNFNFLSDIRVAPQANQVSGVLTARVGAPAFGIA